MKKTDSLIIVVIWLAVFLTLVACCGYILYFDKAMDNDLKLGLQCTLTGGAGGVLYLLRATYLNFCVHDNWKQRWLLWYFLRPFASMICGGVSMVFLKAGLLVLTGAPSNEVTVYGFIAFSFFAGLNVDNFLRKLEELAEVAWSISKTRASDDQVNSQAIPPTPNPGEEHFDTLPLQKQFELAEKWVEENTAEYKQKYPEITGIFAARKIANGKILETVSVTFQDGTKENVPTVLPVTVSQDNYQIPTDVQQAGNAIAQNLSISSGISRQQNHPYGTLGTPVTKDGELYFMSCYHVYCNVELSKGQLAVTSGNNYELISPCFKDLNGNSPTVVGNVVEGFLTDFLDVAFMKPKAAIDTIYPNLPGPVYYRTLTRAQENKIYLRFKGHGSGRFCEGMLRNIFTNQYIDYLGKENHYMRGLIAIDRCAASGDSGAAVCDLAGNYVGYVIASDELYTYIISAYTISDKTNYKFI